MPSAGTLTSHFDVYWNELTRCEKSSAYWALLHLTVCLPDICAALQSVDGRTSGRRYVAWSDRFAIQPYLTGAERYQMRCNVLHQGRARLDPAGRYSSFCFGRPSPSGGIDHYRLDGTVLHIDVGSFARETTSAVEEWIAWVESDAGSPEALAVQRNITTLVHVDRVSVRVTGSIRSAVFMKTN
jgi:hypothetical protein